MCIVKIGEGVYINVERVTFVTKGRKDKIVVHFSVGSGEYSGGVNTRLELKGQEAANFLRWLDANSEKATTA